MNKLKVDRNELINFNINKLKDYEGCPEAAKLLFRVFGEEDDSLFKHEKFFFKLILEHNKPHWSTNFIANLIQDKWKFKFIERELHLLLDELKDKMLDKELKKSFRAVVNDTPFNFEIILASKRFEADMLMQNIISDEDKYNLVMFKVCLIEGMNMLLDDKERKFTRSLTSAMTKFAEAKTYLNPQANQDNVNEKQIALRLLDYSGIFK